MAERDALLPAATPAPAAGVGGKTVRTVWGSMLLLNNLTGPGLPLLPLMIQQAGYVVPVFALVAVALLSALSATMLTEAMKYVPGNDKNFNGRTEYSSLAKFYLGKKAYWATQIILNLSLMSLNLVSMLESIQVMDWCMVAIFACTYGIVLEPTFGPMAVCPVGAVGAHQDSPFRNSMVAGLGFLCVVAMVLPLGYFNLDDNIKVQVGCILAQAVIYGSWVGVFLARGFAADAAPAFGSLSAAGNNLGQIMLNYAFVMTIPSWCNEKHPSSSVNATVYSSVLIATTIYVVIGVMGAFSATILTAIVRASGGSTFDLVTVYLFPLVVVSSSIPIYCIIIRYNLIENGLCSLRWANFWACVFPWLLVIPLTGGNAVFNNVANITSIVLQIPINLVIPFAIYLLARRRKRAQQQLTVQEEHSALVNTAPTPPWSKRYPRVARLCGVRVCAWMDADEPVAPEHFALPEWIGWRAVAMLGAALAVLCSVMMVLALVASVYVLFAPTPMINCTAGNLTQI